MKRRELLQRAALSASAAALQTAAQAAAGQTIHLNPVAGLDSNPGTRAAPMRTLAAAARRVNAIQAPGPVSVVLDEGIYAATETAVFQPARAYSRTDRLTIRAAILPDDPEWHQSRMPTFVHAMPLSPDWNGRPDPFGGVAYGIRVETSHVSIQGLRMFGMPVVERPKPGAIHRLYTIGRHGRELEDLEVKQCLFAGDEITNPCHLPLLVNGHGLVVEHCLFYEVKQTVVYWTPGSKGHAMRNCLVIGGKAGVWTSGIAADFDYRNNVVSNSQYVWIGQGARSAQAELDRLSGARTAGTPGVPAPADVRYRVRNSLFAGNKRFTGSGAGPAMNFKDNDPSFLELIDTKRTEQPVELELDQTKRNYLHAAAGTEAARIGAGLFQKPAE